ncbi:gliding motility-associated C-terminal domain-containing protein [Flavobacterium sp. 123]|uniref:HYR-like domain-containing protein n=1 Tax=Flavobacterium sp. 123 TaxID=2135627 RepID=UPI000EAC941F|nr:gliding motility-associated C-terminal domain-containing protein [Flavobacterium sp. 123]RKT00797.1 gliding motility-associated-like protein [Flavobacterium sp. 123]
MKNSLPKRRSAKNIGVTKIISLLVFLLSAVSSFSQTCSISQTNPCPSSPVSACTTGTGLYSTDPALNLPLAPGYFLSCNGGGTSGYQYENSFDIPESQSASDCWKYSRVQRIGNLGGVLNLFQSTGTTTSVTTPFFYMMPTDPVDIKLDVFRAGTSLFKINYYLEDKNGNKTLQGFFDVNGSHLTNTNKFYTATITAPSTTGFRIYFEFVPNPTIGNGDKNRVDWLGIDAPIYGTGCSGDANFSTTVTGLLPFFPIGSTPVTYTATYRNSAGDVLDSKICTYNVIVNKTTFAGVPTSATCTTNGSIQITAASANTSTNNIKYTINGGSPISLTGSLSTVTTTAINDGVTTTTTYSTVIGTISNLSAGSYTISVSDDITKCSDSKEIIVLETPDTVAPVIPTLANVTGQCSATATVPTTTDVCAGTITGTTSDPLTYSTQGSHTITWTFNDGNGQSVTATQNVIIDDTVAPVIPTLANVTGQCSATATVPTTTDVCAGTITGTTSDPLTYSTQGSHTITWTFNDGNGQSVTATQNVIIDDTVAPVIPTLANVTGQCSATATVPITTDVCAGTITGTTSDPLTYSTQGSHTITWTFNDGNGQSVTATQNVIIDDTVAPVIPTLANVTGQCSATATVPTTTDVCAGTITGTTSDPLTYSTQGSHTITWTFNDGNGQSVTATQNVIIDDTVAPVIPTLANVTGQCSATATVPITTDVCAGTITGTTSDPLTYSTQGSHTITWTFNDGNGQSVTATQNVIIDDTVAPVIPTLANVTGQCSATATVPITTDVCAGTITGTTSDPLTYSTQGSHTITWTFNDGNGQSVTATQNVIIDDTVAPVIPTLANVTGQCSATATVPTTTDVCAGTITGTTSDPLTYSTQGSHTITWTFNDGNGQSVTATQNVIIDDTVAPVIPTLANVTGQCSATATVPTTTDVCAGTITGTTSDPLTYSTQGSHTITWTFNDGNGQSVTATQNVIIDDTVAPVIPTLANVTGQCSATATVPTTTDVCAGTITGTTSDPLTYSTQGSHTITWTFNDGNGQSVTATQNVIIDDTVAPVIPTLANVTGQCSATATVPTTTDVCAGTITGTTSDPLTYSTQGSHTITWTFNDGNGQSVTATQNVIIDDTVAPVIPTLANVTGQCSATATVPTTTDVCAGTITGTTSDPLTYSTQGSHTITWTFNDGNGQSVTATQNVIIDDTVAPVITQAGENTTIYCPNLPVFTPPTATDNCSIATINIVSDVITPGSCSSTYSRTITWDATDGSNNHSETVSQTINVQDITAPTFTVPADITINTGENCSTNLDPTAIGTVTNISDACDSSPEVTYTDSNCFGDDNEANINAGNGNYFYFDVTGYNNLTAKDIEKVALAFKTNQGKGRAEFTLVSPSGQAVVLVGPYCTDGACEDDNSSNQELYVPVFYPNSSGYAQWNNNNVIAQDIPQNFTPNGALSSPNTITGVTSYVSSFDNLTGPMNGTWFVFSKKQANVNGSINFNSVCLTPIGTCPSNKVISRTWTVTDECGNATSAKQTITIQDVTAPVISALPVTTTISCPAVPEFTQAIATDNCSSNVNLTSADVTTNGDCAGSYSVTRTWTATDACGNTSTASQTINVQDITAPVIAALPEASTINCPATPIFALATATDGCNSTFSLTSADVTTNGDCAGSYSVTRTWTATDACGNTSTASQTINVQDITAPVIAALPEVSTINCPATPEFAVATATDGCNSTFSLTSADVTTNGDCAGSYSVTRTWTATDACGNTATASQTINVQDITAPVIAALPEASTINCPATPEFAVATATDDCGSTFSLTSADVTTNGDCAGSYSVTRTWTATDACGNTATASQTINVQDITAPVIAALPEASTINCPATPEFAVATATDGCNSTFSLTSADVTTNGDCAGSYSVTRTWTATDACGNTSTASQTINVQDITAPVIAALPEASTINCPATPEFAVATATDGCNSTFSLTSADVTTNGDCAGSYSVTRTWTATDACGNTSTASQTINVQDITAPVIAALPEASTINCPATPEFAVATATDGCNSTFSLTSADVTTNGDCAGSYSVTRTWTATDACGNTSTASQTINVQDITAPVIAALPEASTINCPATPEFAVATATDGCNSTFSLTSADVTTNGACAGSYSVTRTWTATDACGNTSTASQTINVQDITAPVIAALPEASTINCPATPEFDVATATDDCGSTFSLTSADVTTNGDCAGSYSVTRTWTATDACGNTATASQTINVQDITAPVIAALPEASTINCPATPEFAVATATDDCGSTFSLTSADVTTNGDCAGSYSVTRTWTATDACGNTATASQTINVQDITGPTFVETIPENITVECSEVPTADTLTATDNCSSATVTFEETTASNEGACAGSYTLTRTWTATDACGNTTTASQTITVQDTVAPTFVETAPENITAECSAIPEAATLTATDNCGDATVTFEETTASNEGACAGSYTLTRTWTATDACGNTTTASQTITVQDTVAPTTTTAFETTVIANCDAVPPVPELVFVDNCSSVAPAVYTETITNSTPSSYSIVREWSVSDACGNTSLFSQTVNVTIANSLTTIPSEACNGDSSTIDLMNLLPQGTPTNGTWIDTNTTNALQGSIFSPSGLPLGSVSFEYKINDETCPRSIVLNIAINDDCVVLACGTVLVHNAFSPNGDALNQKFVIDNIDDTVCYPENTVEIYNRWGVLVFETKNYNNNSNYFDGTSKGRTTISASSGLPTGTYFYILNYTSVDNNNNIVTNKKDGYLYLSK